MNIDICTDRQLYFAHSSYSDHLLEYSLFPESKDIMN